MDWTVFYKKYEMESMTKEEAITELKKVLENQGNAQDAEGMHWDADQIVIKFLEGLGHKDLTELWREVPKWYA